MLTNKIWLRKTIVCLKSVLLIHEIAVGIFSPYAPLGKAKINPNLMATFCNSKLQFFYKGEKRYVLFGKPNKTICAN